MTNRNRNQPCPCGSGLKQKKCHVDPVKIMLAQRAYKEKLDELIEMEVEKKYKQLVEKEAKKELVKKKGS